MLYDIWYIFYDINAVLPLSRLFVQQISDEQDFRPNILIT